MRYDHQSLRLSASDLANHLGCSHLTYLDLCAARGELAAPSYKDPALEALRQRGFEHERGYIEHLGSQGLSIVELAELGDEQSNHERTVQAMKAGPDVIVQATLLGDGWLGRSDVLLRVDKPSNLGKYAYEIADTKLARETKGRTMLQLCLYSDLLRQLQGMLPEYMYVVPPGNGYKRETYRVDDYMAYYRLVRQRLIDAVRNGSWHSDATYPDKCEQCNICRWWKVCDDKRHEDDHLCLVAGISKMQIGELQTRQVDTLEALAQTTMPLNPSPERGAPETYERVHHQARVQLEGRVKNKPVHELLVLEEGFGLYRLPKPTSQDIFFDFEGARFVGDEGLEYLFGYVSIESGGPQYHALWAMNAEQEKATFEAFIDEAMARWEADKGFHIYHYAPYEPSAIKRLMGRYAAREDEVDRLLRGERFIDLYAVVKHAVRASVESYSIKDLEPFFGFERQVNLRDASHNLRALEYALEFDAAEAISDEVKEAVRGYNEDDCLATLRLRDWLESLRAQLVADGEQIPRPEHGDGMPSEALDEAMTRVQALATRLTEGIPVEREDRTRQQQAQWILAQLLEWHRREDKAIWWEYFRLVELSDEELLDERDAIGCLQFVEHVEEPGRGSVIDRYRFPHQEVKLRTGNKVLTQEMGTKPFAEIVGIDPVRGDLLLKKGPSRANIHPSSVFAHDIVGTRPLREALFRIGEWVADHGIDANGFCRAGRDLLLAQPPRLKGEAVEQVMAR
ncbi:TM0106 family RecB-like putative nuclease, partial [Candidatus Bipolaricaulota bacterium]|nr:TM0106 family RecB-like putative nuclease [Candidatus Bipolaricaulota bacterium]